MASRLRQAYTLNSIIILEAAGPHYHGMMDKEKLKRAKGREEFIVHSMAQPLTAQIRIDKMAFRALNKHIST
jgi:hypothetical protein